MKLGDRVQIFDRYRFAIPVYGTVVGFSDSAPGVRVRMAGPTNNPMIKPGQEEWFFEEQLRPAPQFDQIEKLGEEVRRLNEIISAKNSDFAQIVRERDAVVKRLEQVRAVVAAKVTD